MNFQQVDALLGSPQINFAMIPDSTQRLNQGMIITAVDNYWGAGEFMYGRYSAAIRQGGLCSVTPVFDSTLNAMRFDFAEVANTANQACMCAVANQAGVTGNYGWFQITGLAVVNSTASVAAGSAIGIGAVGQAGAVTASKQVLNAKAITPATQTVVINNCSGLNNALQIRVPKSDGWFAGAYLSGTGIQAGTTIVSIDPSTRIVTLSLATNALVSGPITATYNNGTVFYNVVHLNRPFLQGAIT